jgi:hypothetical protein
MGTRALLRAQITRAWKEAVDAYIEQKINTEGDLQFHFCRALEREFEEKLAKTEDDPRFYRRLCQLPALRSGNGDFFARPDVVVCDGNNFVVGVIELKYTPRMCPDVHKDLSSLRASLKTDVTLALDRYHGPMERQTAYAVAGDAVSCWAGIYADDSVPQLLEKAFHSSAWEGSPLLALLSQTSPGKPAAVRRLVLQVSHA